MPAQTGGTNYPEPWVDLFYDRGCDGSFQGEKSLAKGRLLGTGALMYPTIATNFNDDYVYVTDKEDQATPSHTYAQLGMYRQNRTYFPLAYDLSSLGSGATNIEHGRPELVMHTYYGGTTTRAGPAGHPPAPTQPTT